MRLFDPGIKLIQALSGSHSERNIILRRAKLSIVITRFSIQYAASIDTTLLRLSRILFAPFTTYIAFFHSYRDRNLHNPPLNPPSRHRKYVPSKILHYKMCIHREGEREREMQDGVRTKLFRGRNGADVSNKTRKKERTIDRKETEAHKIFSSACQTPVF